MPRETIGVLLAAVVLADAACSSPPPPVTTALGSADGLAITYRDELGESFKLVRIETWLDDEPIYICATDAERPIDARVPILIFDGQAGAGQHALAAKLDYQGNGYGVFSYLKRYHFTVRDRFDFSVTPGSSLLIEATSYERGGITTPVEDRPAIRFETRALFSAQLPARTGCPLAE